MKKKKEILPHYGNEHAANAGNVKVPRHVDIADVISKDTHKDRKRSKHEQTNTRALQRIILKTHTIKMIEN